MYPFMGITMHWAANDWSLKDLGLALVPLKGPHTGENICEIFVQTVGKFFRILQKVNDFTFKSDFKIY